MNMNPTKGSEQKGYRPVLVVHNASLPNVSNMTIICPITNTYKASPVHVRLEGLTTTGYVMCDQVRAVDLRARDYIIIETIDDDVLWEVCDILQGIVGIP